MDATRSQNSLDHDYALFYRHVLALDYASNFIGHFDCSFIVGNKQGVQDCFELINKPRAICDAGCSRSFFVNSSTM